MEKLKVEITFIEPILGTMPGDPELVEGQILRVTREKHPELPQELEEETLESMHEVEEEVDKQSTWFARDKKANGEIMIWDYMFRGFFKAACGALRRVPGTHSNKLKAYKKVVDTLVFVSPRRIHLEVPKESTPESGRFPMLERPLRASGPKGDRVCLARSEMLPEGTSCTIEIEVLDPSLLDVIEEWLDYGKYSGIGRWRNASYGRFTYEWEKPQKKKKGKKESAAVAE